MSNSPNRTSTAAIATVVVLMFSAIGIIMILFRHRVATDHAVPTRGQRPAMIDTRPEVTAA
jgi:hypothetical protein